MQNRAKILFSRLNDHGNLVFNKSALLGNKVFSDIMES